MSRKESLDALRKKIDHVDEKIVSLLNERALLARKVGETKSLNQEDVYVPSREKEILQRLASLNRGPLGAEALRSIYREVLSASRSLEAPIKVAYLGPEATFTHQAAREKFGSSTAFTPLPSIADVFQEVTRERTDYGVVPIENSTEGVVTHTLDLLVEAEVRICAEIYLEIHLHLLSRSGRFEDVRRIVSHPQALAQCRRWLASHCPQVAPEPAASTAQAARMALEDGGVAAIASGMAKDHYGLAVVAADIEDQASNTTRFFVIGDQEPRPSGDDKTSIVFSVKDEVGILHRMLQAFAKERINLTKIESRPLKQKAWEYLFFLDFEGHIKEPRVRRAIGQVEKRCTFIKVLGSYPAGL